MHWFDAFENFFAQAVAVSVLVAILYYGRKAWYKWVEPDRGDGE